MENIKYTYKEVEQRTKSTSVLILLVKKAAIYIVYKLQSQQLTANMFSMFSFLLVLVGIIGLFGANSKTIFISAIIVSYLFDCVDGIWARLKKEDSRFGKFFDPFLDKVKDSFIDLSLIIYYLEVIQLYIHSQKLLVTLVALYFTFKIIYFISRDNIYPEDSPIPDKPLKLKIIHYGGAEKNVILYPFAILNFYFFGLYILGFLALYFVSIIMNVYKASKISNE